LRRRRRRRLLAQLRRWANLILLTKPSKWMDSYRMMGILGKLTEIAQISKRNRIAARVDALGAEIRVRRMWTQRIRSCRMICRMMGILAKPTETAQISKQNHIAARVDVLGAEIRARRTSRRRVVAQEKRMGSCRMARSRWTLSVQTPQNRTQPNGVADEGLGGGAGDAAGVGGVGVVQKLQQMDTTKSAGPLGVAKTMVRRCALGVASMQIS